MKALRTLLILSHRYIGIPLSFMFVLWFASAFVMIYAGGMPRITPEMRIESAAPINFQDIILSPQQAAQSIFVTPNSAKLTMVLGRPLYEFQSGFSAKNFVFADNGAVLNTLDTKQAQTVASRFLDIPYELLHFQETVYEADQWTLTNRNDLPLLKFIADDDLGTEIYVSPSNANVTVYTTSQSRMLAWLGTIPHWLYFTSLRTNQPLWYNIVVWSSGIGCVMALLGLILGFTQLRKVKPFKLARAIPYQGLMRWHYILGTLFGVLALTWVFSGLLSMESFTWTNVRALDIDRGVYREGSLDINAFENPATQNWSQLVEGEIKELEFEWIQGQPYFIASYSRLDDQSQTKREKLHQPYTIIGQAESNEVLIDAKNLSIKNGFDVEELISKLDTSLQNNSVVEYQLLNDYDDYYYSRNGQIPLPVLRAKLDDLNESWLYIDPAKSQILTMVHKWSRLERWLYSGLHSLDFAFWYHSRPLWDIGIILLLLGGLGTSIIGLYYGLCRLKKDVLMLFKRLSSLIL